MSVNIDQGAAVWVVWLVSRTLGGSVHALGRDGQPTMDSAWMLTFDSEESALAAWSSCVRFDAGLGRYRAVATLEHLSGLRNADGKAVVT